MKALIMSLVLPVVFGAAATAETAISVNDGWARETVERANVGAGYVEISNSSDEADRLLSATAGHSGRVEIHNMIMDGDTMKMRELDEGLEIPANSTVSLKPGGLHLMFMELKSPQLAGEVLPVTLMFESGANVEVELVVLDMAQSMEKMSDAKSGHQHEHAHDHSHSH